ncbi:MAG: hypothetical protein ACR2Q4_14695 [Geminicoccaceae bacterium]
MPRTTEEQDSLRVADHWLLRGLGGVNIFTLIAIILGGAKLYFDLDKQTATIQQSIQHLERDLEREIGNVERDVDRVSKRLQELRTELRRSRSAGSPQVFGPLPRLPYSAEKENP